VSSPEFWILPIAILGACVGSFLNVVIYRLPRGLSVAQPRWSFCPQCEQRIRPSDNIPLLGWLRLSGRCRDCDNPIPPVYPLIEGLTAILFVAVWDAAMVARVVSPSTPTATMLQTWPLALSLLFLFSSLMAMAVMDLETYTVDIRLCNLAVAVGVACQMAWGFSEHRTAGPLIKSLDEALPPVVVIAAVAAGLAWLGWELILRWTGFFRESPQDESLQADGDSPVNPEPPLDAMGDAPSSPTALPDEVKRGKDGALYGILAIAAVAVALCVWVYAYPAWPSLMGITSGQVRGVVVLFVLMTALIAASLTPREADAEVVAEIESQRSAARSTAIRELAGFAPALIAAGAAVWWLNRQGRVAEDWSKAGLPFLADGALADPVSLGLHGLASAVLAAALGWVVRILGTLAFGKEAFGTGDIYILAAIGAAAGFWIAFIGFFLAAFLALAGVAIMLFRRRAKAVPFGPWLALGSFLALYLRQPLGQTVAPVLRFMWGRLIGLPDTML